MGDEGKLYNGVTAATINSMREMISVADLTFPNYTEACYLTSSKYDEQGVSFDEAKRLLDGLRLIGTKSALITSILVDGTPSVVGYNHVTDKYFSLPYTEIPVHFPRHRRHFLGYSYWSSLGRRTTHSEHAEGY